MSETTLGALAKGGVLSLGDGYRTKQSELTDEGFRIIRVADIKDGRISLDSPDFVSAAYDRQIGAKRATAGDVLLTTKGTVGRVAIVPESVSSAVYSPQLCWFRVADSGKIIPRYLSYWLQSDAFLAQSAYMQGNTDMAPYISLSDLRSSKIDLPPSSEQQAIAEVLGALDDKIAANIALAAAAERLAIAEMSGLSQRTPLADLVNLGKDQLSVDRFRREVLDHYSLPAFDDEQLPAVEEGNDIKSAKFSLASPVVLLSKLNPRFPRLWRVTPREGVVSVASTEFLVLHPRDVSPAMLWSVLAQPAFSAELDTRAAGTSGSHQRVRPADALTVEVRDPRTAPLKLKIATDAALAAADLHRAENRTLAATRDALLPQLMSGKLRVRDAEAAASAAL